MDRAVLRTAADACLRGNQIAVRSAGVDESRQDRSSFAADRPHALSLCARLQGNTAEAGAGLVGVECRQRSGDRSTEPRRDRRGSCARAGQGGRDVQQQRHLPQVRCRHHVSELSRDARRAAHHARPCQYAAAGAVRPTRPGCAHFRRGARSTSAVRQLQGVQTRMSDGHRHGADENRGRAPAPVAARRVTAGSIDR